MSLEWVAVSRRELLAVGGAVVAAAALSNGWAGAQEATPEASPEGGPDGPQADSAFSNEILPTLGLQRIDLSISADGVSGAPAEVAAGELLVNWTTEGVVGYLLFARPVEGLSEEQELEQARQAGSFDAQQAGSVYGGGTNADPDTTVQVVVRLTPGAWTVYASHMDPAGTFETDEVYTLTGLTVTGDPASPSASPVSDAGAALPVDVTVEMHDAAYAMDTDTVGTGPKLWAFPNVGESTPRRDGPDGGAGRRGRHRRAGRGLLVGGWGAAGLVPPGHLRRLHGPGVAGVRLAQRVLARPGEPPDALLHPRHRDADAPRRDGHVGRVHRRGVTGGPDGRGTLVAGAARSGNRHGGVRSSMRRARSPVRERAPSFTYGCRSCQTTVWSLTKSASPISTFDLPARAKSTTRRSAAVSGQSSGAPAGTSGVATESTMATEPSGPPGVASTRTGPPSGHGRGAAPIDTLGETS